MSDNAKREGPIEWSACSPNATPKHEPMPRLCDDCIDRIGASLNLTLNGPFPQDGGRAPDLRRGHFLLVAAAAPCEHGHVHVNTTHTFETSQLLVNLLTYCAAAPDEDWRDAVLTIEALNPAIVTRLQALLAGRKAFGNPVLHRHRGGKPRGGGMH